jgi:hypothetical protein
MTTSSDWKTIRKEAVVAYLGTCPWNLREGINKMHSTVEAPAEVQTEHLQAKIWSVNV